MSNNRLRIVRSIIYLCLFTMLTACSLLPKSLFSTKIHCQILASRDVNPDINGRPSPLVVRIYELKSNSVFNKADFFQLYDAENATLGGDLLYREEFEISPGQGREIFRKTNEQTRYIGVIAAYRDIDQAQWRASTPLELHEKNTLMISAGPQSVTIYHR